MHFAITLIHSLVRKICMQVLFCVEVAAVRSCAVCGAVRQPAINHCPESRMHRGFDNFLFPFFFSSFSNDVHDENQIINCSFAFDAEIDPFILAT